MLLISWPPGVLLWVAIHPFARQWRRLGPVRTYAILGVPSLLTAVAVWRSRGWLLAIDYGTNYSLVANYLALYALLLLSLPTLYLVVILEERELRDRFGAEYTAYCREVPRFLPKSWRGEHRGGH